MHVECVYCAVRAELLTVVCVTFWASQSTRPRISMAPPPVLENLPNWCGCPVATQDKRQNIRELAAPPSGIRVSSQCCHSLPVMLSASLNKMLRPFHRIFIRRTIGHFLGTLRTITFSEPRNSSSSSSSSSSSNNNSNNSFLLSVCLSVSWLLEFLKFSSRMVH